jgi:hypothetical protein
MSLVPLVGLSLAGAGATAALIYSPAVAAGP